MIVETVAIGTELLLGQIANTNAARIGERLAAAGFDHFNQQVVGDNAERMVAALELATSRSDAVIVTGGIGPTQDDQTREALCALAGVELVYDEGYAERLRARWEERGRVMPEQNLRQAYHPEGAATIRNPKGTAQGVRMRIGEAWVFALPGVPAEMIPMLERDVIPFLEDRGDGEGRIVSRLLRTWGESESQIAETLGDLFDEATNPTVAFLASSGEIKVRLTAKAADEDEAEALIAPVEARVRERLGSLVFGADDDTVEAIVFAALRDRGWTLGTAESATGGMIAVRITSIPGASEVFRGSVVSYATGVKVDVLGVDPEGLERGVVSEETALEMARGASRVLGADVVVAVTGSAGPDPMEQAAGTMIVAVTTPEGESVRTLRMPGDRERVRTYTTTAALHLVRLALT
ncbi:MAG: competence/damage-inducible protein A [Acidimicrobiia bacterium]|nr:competence/damage-inducible protein A [Acidimicrobiia bacterium]